MEKRTKDAGAEIVKTTLRVRRDLWDALQHLAIDQRLTMQDLACCALEQYLKQNTKRGGR